MNFKIIADRFDSKEIKIIFLAFEVSVMKKYPMYFYESDLFRKEQYAYKLSLSQKCALLQIYNDALKQVKEKSLSQEITN